jgi:hypothetical protein
MCLSDIVSPNIRLWIQVLLLFLYLQKHLSLLFLLLFLQYWDLSQILFISRTVTTISIWPVQRNVVRSAPMNMRKNVDVGIGIGLWRLSIFIFCTSFVDLIVATVLVPSYLIVLLISCSLLLFHVINHVLSCSLFNLASLCAAVLARVWIPFSSIMVRAVWISDFVLQVLILRRSRSLRHGWASFLKHLVFRLRCLPLKRLVCDIGHLLILNSKLEVELELLESLWTNRCLQARGIGG